MSELRVRPRLKRLLLVPKLLRGYRRLGMPWRVALSMAWFVVTLKLPELNRPYDQS